VMIEMIMPSVARSHVFSLSGWSACAGLMPKAYREPTVSVALGEVSRQ
jgi:hypothetical protein